MKLILKKSVAGYSYDPRRDGVTQSQLAVWLECREKARQRFILGWQESRISFPLCFGSITHNVIQSYRLTVGLHKDPASEMTQRSWIDRSATRWLREEGNGSSENEETAELSAALLYRLFPQYVAKWGADDSKLRWPLVEEKFRYELDGLVMVGKIDALAEDKREKTILYETKNKSWIRDKLFDWLPLDLQLGYYLSGFEIAQEAIATSGGDYVPAYPDTVVYDVLKRPGERRKKDESLNDFADRCGENASKDEEAFQRFRMDLTDAERRRQKRSSWGKLLAFTEWCDKTRSETDIDPLYNPGACEGKYGTCPFLGTCAHGSREGQVRMRSPHPEL